MFLVVILFYRNLAFEKAELSKLGQSELNKYENSLKVYRDYKNTIDTAFDEGKLEVARNLKSEGMDNDFIIKVTGLTKEIVEKL